MIHPRELPSNPNCHRDPLYMILLPTISLNLYLSRSWIQCTSCWNVENSLGRFMNQNSSLTHHVAAEHIAARRAHPGVPCSSYHVPDALGIIPMSYETSSYGRARIQPTNVFNFWLLFIHGRRKRIKDFVEFLSFVISRQKDSFNFIMTSACHRSWRSWAGIIPVIFLGLGGYGNFPLWAPLDAWDWVWSLNRVQEITRSSFGNCHAG